MDQNALALWISMLRGYWWWAHWLRVHSSQLDALLPLFPVGLSLFHPISLALSRVEICSCHKITNSSDKKKEMIWPWSHAALQSIGLGKLVSSKPKTLYLKGTSVSIFLFLLIWKLTGLQVRYINLDLDLTKT